MMSTMAVQRSSTLFSPISFDDVPEEVVLKIIRLLPLESLCDLALLSRRLNYLCLPLYFSERKMPDPREEVKLPTYNKYESYDPAERQYDLLSILQAALFVTSIKRLTISFVHPGVHAEEFVVYLNRLRNFFSKLSSLGEITILHRAHPYHNDTTESIVDNSSWSHIQSSLHKMAAAFGEVLNEVLRASCSSIRLDLEQPEYAILSLEYRFYCRNLGHPSIRKPVTMFKQHIARKDPSTCNMWLQFGSDWELSAPSFFQLQTALRKISPSSSQSNRPFTFVIASTPNLLLPPLSTWTVAILRSSPVTVLKLLDIANGVHGCIWKMIFPAIIKAASTSIKELYVDKCRLIPPDQILRLLNKLPELRSLTLGRCSSLLNDFSVIPPKRPSLSNLHTLCAPLDWIFRFTFGERALPSLRKLVIYPRDSQSASINDEAISTALPALFAKLNEDKIYPKISFTMGPTTGDHVFSFTVPVIPASMDMSLTKEEEHRFNQPMEYPETDMLAAFAWRLQYRCSSKAMDRVTELSIRMSSAEESCWSVHYLTRWITMFKSIRKVFIYTGREPMKPALQRELSQHLGHSLNYLPSIIIDNVLYD